MKILLLPTKMIDENVLLTNQMYLHPVHWIAKELGASHIIQLDEKKYNL